MKKLITTVCCLLAGALFCYMAAPASAEEKADDKTPNLMSGDLLADHVAEAEFTGIIHRPCRFRTSLCPEKCDHPKDFAVFKILKYRDYRKPGKYGDPRQESLMIDTNPKHKPLLQDASILKKIAELKPGDKVVLHWTHYYMHKAGSSWPERPVMSVKPMTEAGEQAPPAAEAGQ